MISGLKLIFLFLYFLSLSTGTVIKSSSSRPRIQPSTKGNDDTLDDAIIAGITALPETAPPQDLYMLNDEKYLNYLSNRKYPKSTSNFTKMILRKSKSDALIKEKNIEEWLFLANGASQLDALIILESPNFYSHQLKNLNITQLPVYYLSCRSISLFTAFLKRFRYFSEKNWIDLHCIDFIPTLLSSPFTFLLEEISKSANLQDPNIEIYFKVILETQLPALIPNEILFFEYWLRIGTSAWKLLKLYFETVESESLNESLIFTLEKLSNEDQMSEEIVDFILSLPKFDLNAKVDYFSHGSKIPFLHVLAINAKLSSYFLAKVLRDPKLDITAASETVSIDYCEYGYKITYNDCPVIALAAIFRNFITLDLLANSDRIRKLKYDFHIKNFRLIFLHTLVIIYYRFIVFLKQCADNFLKK